MGKNRYPKVKLRPDGTKGCRGCGGAIPPTHKTWCSTHCRTIHQPAYIHREVLKRYDYKCAMCGAHDSKTFLEYDHIIPFSEGGETSVENMRPLCWTCHTQRTKEWRESKKASVDMPIGALWMNVFKCTECGQDHPKMTFGKLESVVTVNGYEYELGTPCPVTGKTIYASRGGWTETARTRRLKTMMQRYGRR